MRRGWLTWIPAATWAAVLFAMSSRATLNVELSGGLDKVAHLIAYLILGFLLAFATVRQRLPLLIAVALGLFYGILDEIHQSFVPGRSAEFADWLADGLGTLLGVSLLLLFRRIRRVRAHDLAARSTESTTT